MSGVRNAYGKELTAVLLPEESVGFRYQPGGGVVSVTSQAKPVGTVMLQVPTPFVIVQLAVLVGLPTAVAVKTAPLGRGPTVLPLRTPPAWTMMVGSPAAGVVAELDAVVAGPLIEVGGLAGVVALLVVGEVGRVVVGCVVGVVVVGVVGGAVDDGCGGGGGAVRVKLVDACR